MTNPFDLPLDLSGLNPGQHAAATTERNALVWAGPGTGKTQVAASRAGWLIQTGRCKPHELLVVTFTNRAVNEFRQRLERGLGAGLAGQVRISTFHSLALSLVEMEGQISQRGRLRLLSSEARHQLLTELVTKLTRNQPIPAPGGRLNATGAGALPLRETVRDVSLHISQFKSWESRNQPSASTGLTPAGSGPDPADAFGWLGEDPVWKLARRVYSHYRQHLRANRLLDLDDLIPGAALTLKNHPKLVRLPGVGVRQILLDETQDTSGQQLALLLGLIEASEKELAGTSIPGTSRGLAATQLVAVGDERQTIFSYLDAGGAFERLKKTLKEPLELSLDIQYRYGPTINRAATALSWRLGFEAVTSSARLKDDPQGRFAGLFSLVSTGPDATRLPITVYQAEDEAEEVDFVASEIRLVRTRQPDATIAVLVRTHRQIELVKRGLSARKVNFKLVGPGNPQEPNPSSGQDAPSSTSTSTPAPTATPATTGQKPYPPTSPNRPFSPGTASPDQFDPTGGGPSKSGPGPNSSPEESEPAPVVISTIHASKGAEFEVVFVTGLVQGLFPASQARLLEDLRLFFVAVTRVQYLLYLTYPVRLTDQPGWTRPAGDRGGATPSTFLSILP